MYRKVSAVLFFFFVSVFALSAQSDEWYWNQPISKIDFNGLKNVKKSDLTGITSSFIDSPFTDDVYNELLDRLYSLEYFEDITPYAKHDGNTENVLLVFEVVERPIIKSINFNGNRKIRNGELREQIKNKTSDIYIESKILIDERLIRNFYLKKGFNASYVTHSVEETADGIIVNFDITEGSSSVIREIQFSGNSIVSSRALKRKLSLKEVGLFKDGAYQPSTLEQDKQTIIKYYQERGYADVNIIDVKVNTAFNEEKQRDELTILFMLQEGAQYTYSGLRISGNEVFTDKELLKAKKLKEGQIYNETKFQEDIQAIATVYQENGYMMNEYYPVPTKDSDRHEISYDLTIKEHSRSHIENIIIKGNTKTKEYVIRREVPIVPGDTFSNDKIINGLRNLMNLRYFSTVVPEAQQGTEDNLIDLILSVEEQSTSSVQFGVTFSGASEASGSMMPVSLFAKVENSNLFGEGRTVSASTTVAPTEQSIDFAYSQNWIGNLPIAFSTSLSFAHAKTTNLVNFWSPNLEFVQDRYYMNYHDWSTTLSSGLSRRWTPDYAILTLSGGISTSLQKNVYDESVYVPVETSVSSYANRWGISNSVYTSFSVDNRDINYDPSKGWFMSERIAWHGLIPGLEKEFYARSDTKLEGYLKLIDLPVTDSWSFKVVLAGYTGFSAIIPVENGVSTRSGMYIDGLLNGRGWGDAYKETSGLTLFSNKLELRMPVVPGVIGIDAFWDAAAVKPRIQEAFSYNIEDFYFSYGPGIRFLIPQLPLHLMFAWRYRVVDGQPKFAEEPFHFVLSFNVVNY